MLIISNMGDQVWLITSRHTEPDLKLSAKQIYKRPHRTNNIQLIDIGVKDSVYEADARGLVRVRIGKLNVNLPCSTFKGGCVKSAAMFGQRLYYILTLGWSLEPDKELLPTSISQNMAGVAGEERHTLMSVSGFHSDQIYFLTVVID